MQWCSVKKGKPPNNTMVFIKVKEGEWRESIDVALFKDEQFLIWDDHYDGLGYDYDLLNDDVTHFCIPDPVPLED